MFTDFREYLAYLEKKGLLARIKKEVDVKFEIAAGIKKISDHDGPALLFEKVKGYPSWTVAGGIFGTRKLLAAAFETTEEKLLEKTMDLENKKIPPRIVQNGPCKEIILKGNDVDLTQLPIVTHGEKDAGPYILAGVQLAKDLKTGVRNVSMHRMLFIDKNHLSCWAPQDRHLGRLILQAEDLKRPLGIATAIGLEPSVPLTSQAKVMMGVDELDLAGGFRGAPVDLVRCETIDTEVPAHAEIVIEGETVPFKRVPDGPIGEYPGCYSDVKQAALVKVTAITMRKNAIYQTVLTGMPRTENHWMQQLYNESAAYRRVREIVPEVKAVNVTHGGTSRHHVVVSIKKRHESEARNVILALFGGNFGIKHVIVVDEDIDVFNPHDVEWALNNRMQPDKDIIIIPNLANSTLDPSAPLPRTSAKWGIDATMPLTDNEKYKKVYIPGEDKVDYI